ncbi:MAG: double-strand break repair helicase AddA [bacterium]|nr:double-strand break repair helicase AddA [bacterium]
MATPDKQSPQSKKDADNRRRPDPNVVQRQASDPSASVWVSASAGTGKTKVLTDRTLRLMLNGAKPDQILAITFTRAAASVMTNRIRDELSNWATCDEDTLVEKLTKLTGRKPEEAQVTRARQMFAEFLDAYGGMRIQTIHSFSQSLLRRFPIESGIPPYFDVMDEQTSSEMLREAQADVLRQIQRDPNTALARAVNLITPEVSEDDFSALVGELTYRRGQLFATLEKHGGVEETIDAVYTHLKAPKGLDTGIMMQQLNSGLGLGGNPPDIKALKDAADILAGGTAGDLEKAKMIKAWILHPEQRNELFYDYVSVFLTKEKDMRKRLTTKGTAAAQDAMEREAERLIQGIEAIATMNVARGTESILRLTGAILEKYTEKKRSHNLLDYDDLVHHANQMMNKTDAAGWVLQKLPGNIKHILVDEAQDTNPDQWNLVTSIAREFFTNPARTQSKDNTIFVVGDEKQSIFSFQRADPKEFATNKKIFSDLVKQSGGKWREVDMEIAFRSSPAVTQAVDAVFANPEASDGLFFKGADEEKQVHHTPFRKGQAGVVEVHPILRPTEQEPTKPWSLPLQMEPGNDTSAQMADKIADQIKGWLDSGEELESRKRPINPADILILVRRRSGFVDEMVRALKKRDIPVAGADRMSLREQIAVMDLVALGEVLLFPKDDYKLASLLKSPLLGLSDQQLEDLAVNRPGTLWDALEKRSKAKDANAKPYREAFEYLSGLQGRLNSERPYEFYSSILMNPAPGNAKSGLNAMFGRLGFEAEDPLVEFLNAVERYEKIHTPSLQGFLAWLDAGEAEVKREINLNPESPRVHIMTVHGAKGLESPIVIMPDTTGLPEDNNRARPRFLWPDEERDVPLWVPRSDLESKNFAHERAKAELERDREFRRLMYVAMTRAADRLYVYGHQNSERDSEKSWYSLIRKGIAQNLKDDVQVIKPPPAPAANDNKSVAPEFDKAAAPVPAAVDGAPVLDDGQTILRFGVKQTAKPQPDGLKPLGKAKPVGIPIWARHAPKTADAPVKKFRPSEYKASNDDYAAPSPLEAERETYHRRLGTVVHELFEFLPALPPEERDAAARKYLGKPVHGLTAKDQDAAAKEVMKILNDPEFGALFGPNSRAEVSLTGLFDKDGQKQMMSGQIDRLVVDDKQVIVIDFKNSVKPPKTAGDVSEKYVMQMAAYRLALQQIYPDKEIKAALLYTRSAKLVPLDAKVLDTALDKMGLKPYKKPDIKGPKI